MSDELTRHALAEEWSPCVLDDLFEQLAEHAPDRARELLNAYASRVDGSWQATVRFVYGCSQLMGFDECACWDAICRISVEQTEIVICTMLRFAQVHSAERRSFGADLPERGAGRLLEILETTFSRATDPQLCGKVTPRHAVADTRDALLRALIDRGTTVAVEELERLSRVLSGDHMRAALEAAQRTAIDRGWTRRSLQELLELAWPSKEGNRMTGSDEILISYSHDSDEHCAAVLALANDLRDNHRLNTILDKRVAFPPQGLTRWMTQKVRDARYVLMICTATYRRRAEGRERPGSGAGVSREGLLIDQALYESNGLNEKFIPVLLEGADAEHRPDFVRPYKYFVWPRDKEQLVQVLRGEPESVLVPVGKT